MKLASVGLLAILEIANLAPSAAAQPAPQFVKVGILYAATISSARAGLAKALHDVGYEQGKNLIIELRDAEGRNENLPKLAAELVRLKPDVLIGSSTPSILALKKETDSIPIVMMDVGNPFLPGLMIQSLAHPGGNITGFSNDGITWLAKRLQLAREIFPGICCFLSLRNPSNPAQLASSTMAKETLGSLGIELKYIDASTPEQLEQFMQAPLDVRFKNVLLVGLDALFYKRKVEIAEFALRRGLAMFAPFREDRALISFENDPDEGDRIVATYVDRILKGAKPADLPVQLATKFYMVVNLKTASALGITIPQSILAQADEVIE